LRLDERRKVRKENMTDQLSYEALLPIYLGLPPDAVRHPTIPMAVYIQEAADLDGWLKADLDQLYQVGLEKVFVETLMQRISGARHAQSLWNVVRFAREEAQREWNEKSPDAYDLRDLLVHDTLFAYRKISDLLGRVRAIADGTGHADMLQDLSDIAVLVRANPKPLEKINFDFTLLDQADTMVNTLSPLLATATSESAQDNETKANRDRAYTHLKEAVDEIREHGRYVFWKDEDRRKGYASDYVRKSRKKNNIPNPDA
jgi:hypothetical protein